MHAESDSSLDLEYWIVDPEIDKVKIYRRAGDRLDQPIELSSEAGASNSFRN
jgi:Uma2 family endonuclease